MSHATVIGEGDEITTFFHDGDPTTSSAPVTIKRLAVKAEPELHHHDHTAEYKIPYAILESFVLEIIRDRLISELENVDVSTDKGKQQILTIMNAL